jgi:6,7-dimethyl-8-ribityllumazine synthase
VWRRGERGRVFDAGHNHCSSRGRKVGVADRDVTVIWVPDAFELPLAYTAK